MAYAPGFYAAHAEGALASARLVLRAAFGLLGTPASMVDIGCGTGAWLHAAAEFGTSGLLGLDGEWVPRDRLLIPPDRFLAVDLAAPDLAASVLPGITGRIALPVGLALSMEVAEHLPEASAPGLVSLLAGLADAVLFSAAIPHQGGHDHVNEQWPDAWAAIFAACGFRCFDLLRPALWSAPGIAWWYAQNALLFARAGSPAEAALLRQGQPVVAPARLVHPGLWLATAPAQAAPPELLRAARPFHLQLPLAQGDAPATGGPIPLPGGGSVTVSHPNAWSFGTDSGWRIHANAPGTPALQLVYRGLPPAPDGERCFRARLLTAAEAPALLCRVALLGTDGEMLEAHPIPLAPGTRWEFRHDFRPAPDACAVMLELEVAAGAPNNFQAVLYALAPRIE